MLWMASVGKNTSKSFPEFDNFTSTSDARYFHYLHCRPEETGPYGSFKLASFEKLARVQIRF